MITCEYAEYEGEPIDTTTLPPIPLEPEGGGTQSMVIRTGEPLIVDDLQSYVVEKVNTVHAVEDDRGTPRSSLTVPMRTRGETAGVIYVQRPTRTCCNWLLTPALSLSPTPTWLASCGNAWNNCRPSTPSMLLSPPPQTYR